MNGARYCGECGAVLRPAGRFCAACGTPVAELLQDPRQVSRPPAWPSPPPPRPGDASIPPSLTYEVAYPGRQRRRSVLVRPLLLAPHLIVLLAFGTVVLVTATLAAVAVVFTGRYPRGLWELGERYLGWLANVATALALLRDEYPPWGEGATPVRFGLGYPERSGRLAALLRPLLALPSLVAYGLLGYTWAITWLCGWAAILLTGRHPEGLWRFGRGLVRWLLAMTAYVLLLTDRYPPFSVGSDAAETSEADPGEPAADHRPAPAVVDAAAAMR